MYIFLFSVQLTLNRPRGPVARKKPRRASAPPSNQATALSAATVSKSTSITNKSGVKVMVSNEQQREGVRTKETSEDQEGEVETAVSRTPLQLESPMKAGEERTRFKSAPEALSSKQPDISQDHLTQNKKAKNLVPDAGEDMIDGGKRKYSQDGGRNSLKVPYTL